MLSGIVFVIEGVTKFTSGPWVALVLIGAIIVTALRIHRYYDLAGQQLALRPGEIATADSPPTPKAPRVPAADMPASHATGVTDVPAPEAETAEHPERIETLTIVPVAVMDRPPSGRSPTLRHPGSQRSVCISARPPM